MSELIWFLTKVILRWNDISQDGYKWIDAVGDVLYKEYGYALINSEQLEEMVSKLDYTPVRG